MKMINKLMVVLGLAVTLVGCGDPERLSSSEIKWSPKASDYLNEHASKPKGAESEWALEVKDENGIRIVSVFIDSKKAASAVCNPASGVADKSAWPVCDTIMNNGVVAIHWDENDGYRVGGDVVPAMGGVDFYASGEEAVELLAGLRPMFKTMGVIL